MFRWQSLRAGIVFTVILLGATVAGAQVITNTTSFPTPGGFYQSANPIPFNTPFGTYFLLNLTLTNPTNSIPVPTAGGTSTWNVNSFFDVFVEIQPPSGPPPLQGSMTTASAITIQHLPDFDIDGFHEYDTELLTLDIAGGGLPPGVMLRESPTQSSFGHHIIEDLPASQFAITSFIDLQMELSVDDGETWAQALGSTELVNTPEPAAAITFVLAAILLCTRRLA